MNTGDVIHNFSISKFYGIKLFLVNLLLTNRIQKTRTLFFNLIRNQVLEVACVV